MANTTKTTDKTVEDVQIETPVKKTPAEPAPLNLDAKVTVRSIAGWDTGFARKDGSGGDVGLSPYGSARLTRNEIIIQVQNNNVLFSGIDGKGSHATYYIEDEATRKEVDFDSEDGTRLQVFLTDEKITELFNNIKNLQEFEAKLKDTVVTRAEKHYVIQAISKLGINDYAKIRATEKYTGFTAP